MSPSTMPCLRRFPMLEVARTRHPAEEVAGHRAPPDLRPPVARGMRELGGAGVPTACECVGRLMVGRFKDFLSRNDDETIGGELAGDGFSAEIRFEKIEEGDLKIHWSNLVPWGDPTHTKQQSADEFAFFFADAVSG